MKRGGRIYHDYPFRFSSVEITHFLIWKPMSWLQSSEIKYKESFCMNEGKRKSNPSGRLHNNCYNITVHIIHIQCNCMLIIRAYKYRIIVSFARLTPYANYCLNTAHKYISTPTLANPFLLHSNLKCQVHVVSTVHIRLSFRPF